MTTTDTPNTATPPFLTWVVVIEPPRPIRRVVIETSRSARHVYVESPRADQHAYKVTRPVRRTDEAR